MIEPTTFVMELKAYAPVEVLMRQTSSPSAKEPNLPVVIPDREQFFPLMPEIIALAEKCPEELRIALPCLPVP